MPHIDRIRDLDPGSAGVDVSHHQGKICWETVAGEGISFAIVKASQGDRFRDTLWETNLRGAIASGIATRSYHYADPYRSAGPDTEAAHYLNVAGPVETAVLDWEGAALRLGTQSQVDWIDRWITAVDADDVMVYCSLETWGVLHPHLSVEWWVAWWDGSYSPHRPPPPQVDGADIWQWSSRGHVKGISGPVDLNQVL